jgi:hypothetical protein
MASKLVVWSHSALSYFTSGVRILGAAYLVYGDTYDDSSDLPGRNNDDASRVAVGSRRAERNRWSIRVYRNRRGDGSSDVMSSSNNEREL